MKRRFYFGIDVGGTFTKTALADEKCRLIAQDKISSRHFCDKRHFKNSLKKNFFDLLASKNISSTEVKAIGIGLPGPIDTKRGVVLNFPNIKSWNNFSLRSYLKKDFNIPIFVENDANCMALAEVRRGAAQGATHALCVTLGTGVGGGLILNGEIYQSPYFLASEVGHIPLVPFGPVCSCGGRGCLERYVGNRAILAKAKKIFKRNISLEELSRLARAGHPRAKRIWEEAGHRIGFALSSVVNVFNPQVIVIGGGVSQAGEVLLKAIRYSLKQHVWRQLKNKIKITRAFLGSDAGVLGAVLLAKEKIEGHA